MDNITYQLISDIRIAESIFRKLSPQTYISDDWEFRNYYYSFNNYPLFFYTAWSQGEPVALLPLQHNLDKKYLEFFGGSYMEDNNIYSKKNFEYVVQDLLSQITLPTKLEWMQKSFHPNSEVMSDYKYELNIAKYSSSDDYLTKEWSNKSRKNLLAQIKKIHEKNVSIEWDNFTDLKLLAELSKKRFGEESTFLFANRLAFFEKLLNAYECHTITISINGEKQAVGFAVLWNDIYIGINSGTNREINGLGKYLTLQKIEQAIQLRAKTYDARTSDSGWKEAFHFSKRPQYSLEVNK